MVGLGVGAVPSQFGALPFFRGGWEGRKTCRFWVSSFEFPRVPFSLFPRPSSRSRCEKRIIGGNHVRSDYAWDEVTSSSSCTLVSAGPMLLLRPGDACYCHVLEPHTFAQNEYGKEGRGKETRVGGQVRGNIVNGIGNGNERV